MDWQALHVLLFLVYTLFVALFYLYFKKRLHHYKKNTQYQEEIQASTIHDIRNPLAVIRLYCELLSKRKQNTRIVQTIINECDIITGIIDKQLEYSRSINHTYPLQLQKIQPSSLLLQHIQFMHSIDKRHAYQFEKLGEIQDEIMADPLSIERVISNVLVNASRYATPKTKITARCQSEAHAVTLAIIDEGPGIPKSAQPQLFKPFKRESRSSQGLGLGLYIAKQLVELHKGIIWFETSPKGTVFYIKLPKK